MTENWHKRHALGLVCQLPDHYEDARAVIAALQDLVDGWLYVVESPTPSKVLSIVRDQA
jgi:hypothetical protein